MGHLLCNEHLYLYYFKYTFPVVLFNWDIYSLMQKTIYTVQFNLYLKLHLTDIVCCYLPTAMLIYVCEQPLLKQLTLLIEALSESIVGW